MQPDSPPPLHPNPTQFYTLPAPTLPPPPLLLIQWAAGAYNVHKPEHFTQYVAGLPFTTDADGFRAVTALAGGAPMTNNPDQIGLKKTATRS